MLLLTAATCIFVVTAFMPRGLWVDGIKAVAEAAMVGALAGWFAVALGGLPGAPAGGVRGRRGIAAEAASGGGEGDS